MLDSSDPIVYKGTTMKWSSYFIILIIAISGCATVGFGPRERCAEDGMIFNGRNYSSNYTESATFSRSGRYTGSSESSGVEVGISCSRPASKEEKCEMQAATLEMSIKAGLCGKSLYGDKITNDSWLELAIPSEHIYDPNECRGAKFTEETANKIERQAEKAAQDALDICLSQP
jgi:hypothetical protein